MCATYYGDMFDILEIVESHMCVHLRAHMHASCGYVSISSSSPIGKMNLKSGMGSQFSITIWPSLGHSLIGLFAFYNINSKCGLTCK